MCIGFVIQFVPNVLENMNKHHDKTSFLAWRKAVTLGLCLVANSGEIVSNSIWVSRGEILQGVQVTCTTNQVPNTVIIIAGLVHLNKDPMGSYG